MVVNEVPVVPQAVINVYPTIAVTPSPYFILLDVVAHAEQVVAADKQNPVEQTIEVKVGVVADDYVVIVDEVEHEATLVGADDPKHEKHPTIVLDVTVLLLQVELPVTRAKYPVLQVIEVALVKSTPLVAQAVI